MADVFTKAKRSEVMSRIRGRGNKDTELALAKLLRAHKISGWRRHLLVRVAVDSSKLRVERRKPGSASPRPSQRGEGVRRRNSQQSTLNPPVLRNSTAEGGQLAVRPDFVFPKSRTAVFVDGCFWHGCPKHATQPASNRAFWKKKLARNRVRDVLVNRTLRAQGWRVLRIWEHDLHRATKRSATRKPQHEMRLVRRILARLSR
jgi:DNA mismatch endonuclease (patch repair protein)